MPGDLNPGFIKVEYHSAYAPHVMILPVNTIEVDESNPLASTIENWAGAPVDWVTMVEDLVTALADAMPTTVTYDLATLFNKPTVEDLPQPIASTTLAIAGTVAVPGWSKAAQETIVARDTGFNIAKLTLMDFASGNNWEKQITVAGAGVADIIAEWFDAANGWSSQMGMRPITFVATTRTLNEKLRRSYRMA